MLVASRDGDLKKVQALLDRGANPNARDRNGYTALMYVLGDRRSPDAIAFWERQKLDVNVRDRNGWTLLMHAARAPVPDLVTFLLDHGAEVDARDREGHTALMATVVWSVVDVFFSEDDFAEAAERLIARGANVNTRDRNGRTALTYAAGRRHLPQLLTLLKHGANVHLRDRVGRTAMAWAARYGAESEMAQALIRHGAVPGLVEAILWNDRVAVQKLLSGNATLNERDADGETPLMMAAERGDLPLLRALLAKRVNPNAQGADGSTALMLAFSGRENDAMSDRRYSGNAEDEDRFTIVEALLQSGARVNAWDGQGRTPLLRALTIGTPAMIHRLLEAGANVNAADREGRTPLMAVLARRQGDDRVTRNLPWSGAAAVAEALLTQGANVNARDRNGDTALHQIVHQEGVEPSLLNLLLAHGADVSLRDRNGQTSLICSAQDYNHAEVKVRTVKRLLDAGANAFARDRYGATTLTYAAYWECQPLVDLLRGKGLKVSLLDAVLLQDVPTVRARLAAGANPNAALLYGETALMIASRNGDIEIVRALLAHGADVKRRVAGTSQTALRFAHDSAHPEVEALLKRAGAQE